MTQLEKELQDVSNVAIAGHIHPDGDSVGSCIGLWQYLRDNYPQIKADIWLSVWIVQLWIVWVTHCRIFRRQSVLSAWIIM